MERAINPELICFKCRGDGFNIRRSYPALCEHFKENKCCYFYGYLTDNEKHEYGDEYPSSPDELALSEIRYTEAYEIHGEIIKDIERFRRFVK